jgi:hypothetical protein
MHRSHVDQPTESQCVRIRVIDAWEALGYRGIGREEHSGENAPADPADLDAELADNRPKQISAMGEEQ